MYGVPPPGPGDEELLTRRPIGWPVRVAAVVAGLAVAAVVSYAIVDHAASRSPGRPRTVSPTRPSSPVVIPDPVIVDPQSFSTYVEAGRAVTVNFKLDNPGLEPVVLDYLRAEVAVGFPPGVQFVSLVISPDEVPGQGSAAAVLALHITSCRAALRAVHGVTLHLTEHAVGSGEMIPVAIEPPNLEGPSMWLNFLTTMVCLPSRD